MASDGSVVIDIEGDSSKFKSSLSGLGSIASGALKGIGVAAAAAAGAVGAVGKAAVDAFADYEQLVGGVETLFQDSASIVENYAATAYKTAGLSANEYMETVTSFSASLLQSVAGDTAEAARAADMAITDMADNANKMGSSMESIQNAYQGFAKQNYTMLDNLKLGYGGTKAEMERLLADAEKLTGIQYDISNLNDVYEAIHVIQTELGITGTTAAEASTTIQGSVASMKAAWENLLVGLADDTQDFDALLSAFIDSVGTVGENLIPRIQVVLSGIVRLVTELGPMLAAELPGIANSVLPGLIEGAAALIGALAGALPELFQTVIDVMMEQGPSLIQVGADLLGSLYEGLTEALPGLTQLAADIITYLATELTNPEFLTGLVAAGTSLLQSLVQSILDAVPALVEAAPVIIENLVTALIGSIPLLTDCAIQLAGAIFDTILSTDWISLGVDILNTLINGILSLLGALLEAAGKIVSTIWDKITSTDWPKKGAEILIKIISGIKSLFSNLGQTTGDLVSKIWDKITTTDWLKLGSDVLSKIINGIESIFSNLGKTASDLAGQIWDTITHTDWLRLGGDIIRGIASGVSNAVGSLIDAARNVANRALGAIKSALGINSPSKVFAREVGHWIPPGIGMGMEGAMPKLTADMRRQMQGVVDDANRAVSAEIGSVNRSLAGAIPYGYPGNGDPQTVNHENGISVVVYYTGNGDPTDVKQIGRKIGAEAARELRRRGVPAT